MSTQLRPTPIIPPRFARDRAVSAHRQPTPQLKSWAGDILDAAILLAILSAVLKGLGVI